MKKQVRSCTETVTTITYTDAELEKVLIDLAIALKLVPDTKCEVLFDADRFNGVSIVHREITTT